MRTPHKTGEHSGLEQGLAERCSYSTNDLTLVTKPMTNQTTPFSHCRLRYGFNCYHNSDVSCCSLRP